MRDCGIPFSESLCSFDLSLSFSDDILGVVVALESQSMKVACFGVGVMATELDGGGRVDIHNDQIISLFEAYIFVSYRHNMQDLLLQYKL